MLEKTINHRKTNLYLTDIFIRLVEDGDDGWFEVERGGNDNVSAG